MQLDGVVLGLWLPSLDWLIISISSFDWLTDDVSGKVICPKGNADTTGIIPSKQRVERKERSRLKKVLFSGKKDGQPGDGKLSAIEPFYYIRIWAIALCYRTLLLH